MQGHSPRVAIVGGGIVGLCCAFELERRGAEVLVVERDRFGGGASRGNAGWVVPALSAPLAAPGVTRQALAWLLRRDSQVRIRPRPDLDLLSWGARFLRSSSSGAHAAGLRAKLAFGAQTLALFDGLRDAGVEFEMHARGLLSVALSPAGLDAMRREVDAAVAAGYAGDVRALDAEAARSVEPALGDGVAGALLLADERHIRPESLTAGLVDHLRARGVALRDELEVRGVRSVAGRGWELRCGTAGETFRADHVVVAAGAWSARLLRPLGVRLPLQGARGCSITASGTGTRPTHALKLVEARVACTPFDGAVRMSGTFELTGLDDALNRRRLDAVVAAARPYLRDWTPTNPELRWAGLRAATPDDLPLIGELPRYPRLHVATGHGTLGVTLAPATAAAVAGIVLDGARPAELDPFRPDRFG